MSTDPEGLREEDLPIAAGSESPAVLDGRQDRRGRTRARQVLAFFESAGQASTRMASVTTTPVRRRWSSSWVDIEDDLFGQGGGRVHALLDRRQVRPACAREGPSAFKATLDKLGGASQASRGPRGRPVGYSQAKRRKDFYALPLPSGSASSTACSTARSSCPTTAGEAGKLLVLPKRAPSRERRAPCPWRPTPRSWATRSS